MASCCSSSKRSCCLPETGCVAAKRREGVKRADCTEFRRAPANRATDGCTHPMLYVYHLLYKSQIERREAAQLKERAVVVPATRSTTPIWRIDYTTSTGRFRPKFTSTIRLKPEADATTPAQETRAVFSVRSTAGPGTARSSRRGWCARRCRRRHARRGGCHVVTLGPSFMPRLLTRVPPFLSYMVSCDMGGRRCRLDIWRFRRQCRSGHWRRCRGNRRRRRWALAACGDERQSGRDHQRYG